MQYLARLDPSKNIVENKKIKKIFPVQTFAFQV